jgi:hypothetical protein
LETRNFTLKQIMMMLMMEDAWFGAAVIKVVDSGAV